MARRSGQNQRHSDVPFGFGNSVWDFVHLKTKSACDHYWDKTTEKTIQGQSRPNEASISLLYDWHCTLLQP